MRATLLALALVSVLASAAPVPVPVFTPDGTRAQAPLRVTIRCPAADAAIYVTLDGQDPTTRDTEIDPGSTILLDQPCTLKARAVLPDGSTSAVHAATYALTPAPGLSASFVEQEVPARMAAGRPYKVSVMLRNTGSVPLNPEALVLAPRRAKDAATWGVPQVKLKQSAGTWKTAAFDFQVMAPTAPGTYSFQWQLRDASGKGIGEPSTVVRVEVLAPEQYAIVVNGQIEPAATGHVPQAREAKPGATEERKARAAKVAKLAAAEGVRPGTDLDRLVRALASSGHSFKALRERGFKQSDTEFEKILAEHPNLFRSTRIVRRDEQGRRIIPGWPGLTLKL